MHNQRKWIWRFRALDTLFFRDGTPFNMEETGVAPQGVFPPSIFTLQGAIRAAMAHFIKQWVPGKEWPKELGGEYIDTHGLSLEEKQESLGAAGFTGKFKVVRTLFANAWKTIRPGAAGVVRHQRAVDPAFPDRKK